MKINTISVAIMCVVLLCTIVGVNRHASATVAAFADKLTPDRARKAIRRTAGIELPESAIEVEKESISVLGADATVEARIKTAFRLRRGTKGEWEVAEVRLGADRWEDVTLLRAALDREKQIRARLELETLRTAVEAFRRERGRYPPVTSGRELVDHLSPRYLSVILRLDPWQQPYDYSATTDSYRLRSAGIDRKIDTPDDLIVRANGE